METMTVLHYEIDDELHRQAKAEAALRGVTLKAFLISALEEALASSGRPARRR